MCLPSLICRIGRHNVTASFLLSVWKEVKSLCDCEETKAGGAHWGIKKKLRGRKLFIFLNCSLCQQPQQGVSLPPVSLCSIIPCCSNVQTQPNERATYPVILRTVCSYHFAWVEWPQRALLVLQWGDGSEHEGAACWFQAPRPPRYHNQCCPMFFSVSHVVINSILVTR